MPFCRETVCFPITTLSPWGFGFGDGAAGYDYSYCWVPPMTERLITEAMAQALGVR